MEGGARSEAGAEGRAEGEENRLHEAGKLPPLSNTKRESLAIPHAPRNPRDAGHFGILGRDRRVRLVRLLWAAGLEPAEFHRR